METLVAVRRDSMLPQHAPAEILNDRYSVVFDLSSLLSIMSALPKDLCPWPLNLNNPKP
jgi:hypothetical protein